MNFPIILIPEILISDNYKSYKVEIPELPDVPKEKEIELKNNEIGGVFILFVIFSFFLILNHEEFNSLGMGIILLIISIVYKILKSEIINKDNQTKILKAKKEFEQKKLEYKNAIIKRDSAIAKQKFIKENQAEYIGGKHKVAIINLLQKEKEITLFKNEDSVKKGVTEKQFLDLLIKSKRFNKRILTDYCFGGYFPDFIYYDDIRHIYICIEIDEPYDLQSGKPIHCLDDDIERNDFFVDNLWSVIRFAEYQIVKEPENCIHIIEQVIQCLEFGMTSYINNLIEVKRWNEEEARELEANNYREKYLNIPPVNRPSSNEIEVFEYDDLPFEYEYVIEVFETFYRDRELPWRELISKIESKFKIPNEDASRKFEYWKKNHYIEICPWSKGKVQICYNLNLWEKWIKEKGLTLEPESKEALKYHAENDNLNQEDDLPF
jgi:very-short-patch-repair endonuclease